MWWREGGLAYGRSAGSIDSCRIIRNAISNCTVIRMRNVKKARAVYTKVLINLPKSRAKRIPGPVVRRRADVNFLKGHADLGG